MRVQLYGIIFKGYIFIFLLTRKETDSLKITYFYIKNQTKISFFSRLAERGTIIPGTSSYNSAQSTAIWIKNNNLLVYS